MQPTHHRFLTRDRVIAVVVMILLVAFVVGCIWYQLLPTFAPTRPLTPSYL